MNTWTKLGNTGMRMSGWVIVVAEDCCCSAVFCFVYVNGYGKRVGLCLDKRWLLKSDTFVHCTYLKMVVKQCKIS